MPSLELFLPNDLGLGLFFITTIDNGNHCLREIDEGEACSRVAGEGCWGAGIAVVADALNERYLGEQRYLHLLGKLLAAFLTEDLITVLRQLGRGEPRHILDESEDGHVDLFVAIHIDTLAGIGKSYLLRC